MVKVLQKELDSKNVKDGVSNMHGRHLRLVLPDNL